MNKTNAFAQRLKSRRKELRMTLEDVGNALGVSRVAVSRWENGLINNINIEKIEKIAEVLQCQPSYLIGWTDSINDDDKDKTVPTAATKVLTLMELLKPDEQEQVIKYIQFIISSRN